MSADTIERKLAAILAADVAGYSRLVNQDEEATIRALKAHRRELIDPTIQIHHGRIANTAGDSLLVEFASAVDAVRCAVDIQFGMAQRNLKLPENRRIIFRIGINVGDVIVQGQDLLGDGVNVAARLEQIAQPGEINLSRTVRDHIQDKLSFTFDALGEQTIKNIPRPVEVSRVRWDGYTPAQLASVAEEAKAPAALGLRPAIWVVSSAVFAALLATAGMGWKIWQDRSPSQRDDRPGIAVLPFVNLSGDKEQEYFSDGLAEDLITEISQFPQLRVIARNSTFRYKGQAVDTATVGNELSVRYVLEGSVRRIANQVRITGQLIDASSGGHIWAKHYDRQQKDVFAVQDEMTRDIVSLIASNVQDADYQKAKAKPTESQTAYDRVLLGRSQLRAANPIDYQRAVTSFERAISDDPDYAPAYAGLSAAYAIGWLQGWGSLPHKELLPRAEAAASRAVVLNPRQAEAHATLGMVQIFLGHHQEGFKEVANGYRLNPNSIDVQEDFAYATFWLGRHEEAMRLYAEALKYDPYPTAAVYSRISRVLYFLRQYDRALEAASKAIIVAPKFSLSYLVQAAIYAELGRFSEARAAVDIHQRLRPGYAIATAPNNDSFFKREDKERWYSALGKAGVPMK